VSADIVVELALRAELRASLIVSRIGDDDTISLPLRCISWRRLPGRVAAGSQGAKFAIVQVTMPLWLAADRRLK
jgi:hypothetical protein